jgi:ABC-2 type transport system ATP-binding protein
MLSYICESKFVQAQVMVMDDIVIQGLTKRFRDIIAVNAMNLEVPEGTIFGLLGPNGAGKSTTIRLLCTVLRPNDGTASVASYDILENPVKVREITGVLPEEGNHTLYPGLSAYENLLYFAKLYGVLDEEIPERIHELLSFMELEGRKDDKAGELSTGNRQRLALCRAMLHRPTVLLLDEPTSALDPLAAKKVRELILNLSKEYKQTFFINSHNLAEVQRICDRIAIIDEGKILLTGKTDELREKLYSKQEYKIRYRGELGEAESLLEAFDFVSIIEKGIDWVLIEVANPFDNNARIMKALLDTGINMIEFAEEAASLEDLYLQVIKGGNE